MALETAFTEMFGVRHPIALAPMGGSAGGALAAAVARGGGFGLLGGAFGDAEWLAREVPIVADTGQKLLWAASTHLEPVLQQGDHGSDVLTVHTDSGCLTCLLVGVERDAQPHFPEQWQIRAAVTDGGAVLRRKAERPGVADGEVTLVPGGVRRLRGVEMKETGRAPALCRAGLSRPRA
ncbi:hypothetical protein ACFVZL_31710 [Streptomyces sp. NPDC058320]|uniref:hypothetical protein n=1 Tax=unclassified Streptomyces TaxID=2593676 RepID=UPI00363E32F4